MPPMANKLSLQPSGSGAETSKGSDVVQDQTSGKEELAKYVPVLCSKKKIIDILNPFVFFLNASKLNLSLLCICNK